MVVGDQSELLPVQMVVEGAKGMVVGDQSELLPVQMVVEGA